MIAVDTNILVYAHREEAPFHGGSRVGEAQAPSVAPIVNATQKFRMGSNPLVP